MKTSASKRRILQSLASSLAHIRATPSCSSRGASPPRHARCAAATMRLYPACSVHAKHCTTRVQGHTTAWRRCSGVVWARRRRSGLSTADGLSINWGRKTVLILEFTRAFDSRASWLGLAAVGYDPAIGRYPPGPRDADSPAARHGGAP